MTEAEFLAWQSGQDQRYELVDGVPQAMTGARIRHDIARGNADRHLAPQLRAAGKGCRPFSADIAIRVYPGQLRRPELSVLCPPFDMEDWSPKRRAWSSRCSPRRPAESMSM